MVSSWYSKAARLRIVLKSLTTIGAVAELISDSYVELLTVSLKVIEFASAAER